MRSLCSVYLFSFIAFILFACNENDNKSLQNIPVEKDSIPTTNSGNTANPYASVDVSPMDMSYFPADYPKLKMEKKVSSSPVAKIIYSRPHLGGRRLFPEIQKYGEPWRLGANESTELELYQDVTIMAKKITAGKYVLYCIPQADKWTIVLNSNINSWGLKPDPSQDLFRFEVPVNKMDRQIEFFTMIFEKSNNGADMVMAWDNLEARLPLVF